MARPKPDTDAIKARLITEAEALLVQSDGRKLVLSDIAGRVGMSQSYLHTFFPTKADLVRSLAKQWFSAVEIASRQAAQSDAAADKKLEAWLLSILRIKRNRFDENPKLYWAYLELARNHADLVEHHVRSLRADLSLIVKDLALERDLETTVTLIEDATLLFRTPQNIATYRHRVTNEAAKSVCDMLLSYFEVTARR